MSTNPWIQHVKAVQRAGGLSYKEAMIEGSKTYRRQGGGKPDISSKISDTLEIFKIDGDDDEAITNNYELDALQQEILDLLDEGEMMTPALIEELVYKRRLNDPAGVKSDLMIVLPKVQAGMPYRRRQVGGGGKSPAKLIKAIEGLKIDGDDDEARTNNYELNVLHQEIVDLLDEGEMMTPALIHELVYKRRLIDPEGVKSDLMIALGIW